MRTEVAACRIEPRLGGPEKSESLSLSPRVAS
jgi:hypothetical protein